MCNVICDLRSLDGTGTMHAGGASEQPEVPKRTLQQQWEKGTDVPPEPPSEIVRQDVNRSSLVAWAARPLWAVRTFPLTR